MRRSTFGIVVVLVSLAVVAPSWAQPKGDATLMPADGFTGWKKIPQQRVYTEADLYGYIDGGAELFLEFGFEQLTQQKYTKGTATFTVDLYRMRDPIAATGIYLMKCGNEARRPGFAERHTVSRHQLLFLRDRFFVIISSGSGQESLVPELVAFGGAVASKMPATGPLPIMSQLPKAGQVDTTLRLLRGPYGLQAIYTLGEGDILQLAGKLTAVAADYRDASGAYTRIAASYPTASAATKAFAFLTRNLDSYLKPVEKSAARLVFSDYQKKYGVVAVSGATIDIRVNLATKPAK